MLYTKIFFFFMIFLFSHHVFAGVSQDIYTQGKDWYCDEITLTNNTHNKIDAWELELTIKGSSEITSNWNSEYIQKDEKYIFSPVEYNHTISVGDSRTIGFCTANTLSRPTDLVLKDLTGKNDQDDLEKKSVVISYPEQSWPSEKITTPSGEKIMQINPWNIFSSKGSAQMSYDKDLNIFSYQQDLSSIVLNDAESWVSGYPEIMIGKSPFSETQTSGVILPKKVDEIGELKLKTHFFVENTSNTPLNYASEGWLLLNSNQNDVLKNDIEFMIMWYRSNLGPAGSKIGSVEIPIKVDGIQKQEVFEIYYSDNSWNFFTFLPKNQYNNTSIEIDLAKFFPSIDTKLGGTLKKYTFMSYEIGSEFGSPDVDYGKFSWNLSKFDIEFTKKEQKTEDNSSGGSIDDQDTSKEDFSIDDIYEIINKNEEKRLSFENFEFNLKSFSVFQGKLDKYLEKKMENYSMNNYNLGVENRNGLLRTLKKFEEKRLSKHNTLQMLQIIIAEFKNIHK